MPARMITKLGTWNVGCEELNRDLRRALKRANPRTRRSVQQLFRAEMQAVILGIRRQGRFQSLKRFVAHGSRLPSWEKKYQDTPHALDDEEFAALVDFITGHMLSKFQGSLAEILARGPLKRLVRRLQQQGRLPAGGRLILGGELRCRSGAKAKSRVANNSDSGVQGPDGLFVTEARDGKLRIHAAIEIKSMPVPQSKLKRQMDHHLHASSRGIKMDGVWREVERPWAQPVIRIYVRPSDWRLTRRFSVKKWKGGHRLIMQPQELPAGEDRILKLGQRDRMIELAWSYDALRAAAFNLAHCYMAEVGEALAEEPDLEIPLRTDMSPAQAGQNDLLLQLHVGIMRQLEAEPDHRRRNKTIELYNALGFGWALGHNHRGADGELEMMWPEDLYGRAK